MLNRIENGFKVVCCTNNSTANRLCLVVDFYLQGKQLFYVSLIISNIIFNICLPLDFGKFEHVSQCLLVFFPFVCFSLKSADSLTRQWSERVDCGGYLRLGFVVMQLHGQQCVMNRKPPVLSYEKSQRSCTRDCASHFMKFYSAASAVMALPQWRRDADIWLQRYTVCVCV